MSTLVLLVCQPPLPNKRETVMYILIYFFKKTQSNPLWFSSSAINCLETSSILFLLTGPCSLPEAALDCRRPLFLSFRKPSSSAAGAFETRWKHTLFLCDFRRLNKSTSHSSVVFTVPPNHARTRLAFKNSSCLVCTSMLPKMLWHTTFDMSSLCPKPSFRSHNGWIYTICLAKANLNMPQLAVWIQPNCWSSFNQPKAKVMSDDYLPWKSLPKMWFLCFWFG